MSTGRPGGLARHPRWHERLAAIADAVTEDCEALRRAAMRPLNVPLIHMTRRLMREQEADHDIQTIGDAIEHELNAIRQDTSIKHLSLTVTRKAVRAMRRTTKRPRAAARHPRMPT